MFLQKIVIEKLRCGIILSFFCPPKLCDQKKALETFIEQDQLSEEIKDLAHITSLKNFNQVKK